MNQSSNSLASHVFIPGTTGSGRATPDVPANGDPEVAIDRLLDDVRDKKMTAAQVDRTSLGQGFARLGLADPDRAAAYTKTLEAWDAGEPEKAIGLFDQARNERRDSEYAQSKSMLEVVAQRAVQVKGKQAGTTFEFVDEKTQQECIRQLDGIADHLTMAAGLSERSVSPTLATEQGKIARRIESARTDAERRLGDLLPIVDPEHQQEFQAAAADVGRGDLAKAATSTRALADDAAFAAGRAEQRRPAADRDDGSPERVTGILARAASPDSDPGQINRATLRRELARTAAGDQEHTKDYRQILQGWDKARADGDRAAITVLGDQFASLDFARSYKDISARVERVSAQKSMLQVIDRHRDGQGDFRDAEIVAKSVATLADATPENRSKLMSLPELLESGNAEQAHQVFTETLGNREEAKGLIEELNNKPAFEYLGKNAKRQIDTFCSFLQAKYDAIVAGHDTPENLERQALAIERGLRLTEIADPDRADLIRGVRMAQEQGDFEAASKGLRFANAARSSSQDTTADLTMLKRAVAMARSPEERADLAMHAGFIERPDTDPGTNAHRLTYVDRASLEREKPRVVSEQQLGLDMAKIQERQSRGQSGMTQSEMEREGLLSTKQRDTSLEALEPDVRSRTALLQGRAMALQAELAAADRQGVKLAIQAPDGTSRMVGCAELYREEEQAQRLDAFNAGRRDEPTAQSVLAGISTKHKVDLQERLQQAAPDPEARQLLAAHAQARILSATRRIVDEGRLPTQQAVQDALMPQDVQRRLSILDALGGQGPGVTVGGRDQERGNGLHGARDPHRSGVDQALAGLGLRLQEQQIAGTARRETVLVDIKDPKQVIRGEELGLAGQNSLEQVRKRVEDGERGIRHQDLESMRRTTMGDGMRLVRTSGQGPDGKPHSTYDIEMYSPTGRLMRMSAAEAGFDASKDARLDLDTIHRASETQALQERALVAVRATIPKDKVDFKAWDKRLGQYGLKLERLEESETSLRDPSDHQAIHAVKFGVRDQSGAIVSFEKLGLHGPDGGDIMVKTDNTLYVQGGDPRRDLVGRGFRSVWNGIGEAMRGEGGFMSAKTWQVGRDDDRERHAERVMQHQRKQGPTYREIQERSRGR